MPFNIEINNKPYKINRSGEKQYGITNQTGGGYGISKRENNWILKNGCWDDNGVWDDNAVWID